MSGTIRMEYSVGTTSFGSFPGVLANSKGFSAWMVERSMIKNRLAKKRSGARISRTKQPVPKNCICKGGSACPPTMLVNRSEERRVGKEWKYRRGTDD